MPPPLSMLQRKMRDKLMGGQFRHLNERLYTQTGAESLAMVREDPTAYAAYHDGYRRQVLGWPVNPLDLIIAECSKLAAGSVIADFGCGDARLAATLAGPATDAPPRCLTVHSFDLHCPVGNPFVTACDMAHVPLAPESADAAVFCLSLMGTNYAEFLREADRVLRPGGLLLIAEVRSRFAAAEAPARDSEGLDGERLEAPTSAGHKRPRSSGGPHPSPQRGIPHHDELLAAAAVTASDGVAAFVQLVRALGFRLLVRDEANTMLVRLFFRKRAGSEDTGARAPSSKVASTSALTDSMSASQRKRARRKKNRGTGLGNAASAEPPRSNDSLIHAAAVPIGAGTPTAPLQPQVPSTSDATRKKRKHQRRGGHRTSAAVGPAVAGANSAGSGVPSPVSHAAGQSSTLQTSIGPSSTAKGAAPPVTGGKSITRVANVLPLAPVLKACTYKKR